MAACAERQFSISAISAPKKRRACETICNLTCNCIQNRSRPENCQVAKGNKKPRDQPGGRQAGKPSRRESGGSPPRLRACPAIHSDALRPKSSSSSSSTARSCSAAPAQCLKRARSTSSPALPAARLGRPSSGLEEKTWSSGGLDRGKDALVMMAVGALEPGMALRLRVGQTRELRGTSRDDSRLGSERTLKNFSREQALNPWKASQILS